MSRQDQELLEEQKRYYRERAPEYDEWFQREGRYDHGDDWNVQWLAEVDEVVQNLAEFNPRGQVLELACGTGWWTERLAHHADHITAVDASPEVIERNRARVQSDRVDYVQTDIFAWQPERRYDVVFFSFWLSHVPPAGFAEFWQMVRNALKPGGRVFFIDSLRSETGAAGQPVVGHGNQRLTESREYVTVRKLNDGREFRIVKVFYDPPDLEAELRRRGWDATVRSTAKYLLYGWAQPT